MECLSFVLFVVTVDMYDATTNGSPVFQLPVVFLSVPLAVVAIVLPRLVFWPEACIPLMESVM